jgi:hypothetical protein
MRAALTWLFTALLSMVAFVVLFLASFLPDRNKQPPRYSARILPHENPLLASLVVSQLSDNTGERIEIPLTDEAMDLMIFDMAVQKRRIRSVRVRD